MSISPTLRCPCHKRFLDCACEYESPPEGETAFDLGSQIYRRGYDMCNLCGHLFGRHNLDLSQLYDRDYAEATYGGVEGMRRRYEEILKLPPNQSDNRQRVARILSFAEDRVSFDRSKTPRLLDVGAGLGVFPEAMSDEGWQLTAVETDVRTVAHLRTVVGIEAYAVDLLEIDVVTYGYFDAITFNKVLEHVEDPVALLVAARGLLVPGGFVYVEVPDVVAASEGFDREEFFLEHHHVFSCASIATMGERAQLTAATIERLREPSGKFSLCAFFVCGQ